MLMKTWLKGGIIGGIIGIGLSLILIISYLLFREAYYIGYLFLILPGTLLISFFNVDSWLVFGIVNLVTYFLTGMLIGWFVGRKRE